MWEGTKAELGRPDEQKRLVWGTRRRHTIPLMRCKRDPERNNTVQAVPVFPKEYVYSGSGLLATIANNAVTYHHPDLLSNRLETDSTGNVVRTFGHLPFGEIWYETGTADKWKFTGFERDSESALDHAWFRQLKATYGRWMTPDPAGLAVAEPLDPQSWNRYAYGANDPCSTVDPLGLATCSFNIAIANRYGLAKDQIALIQSRIANIFGATPTSSGDHLTAVFDFSGSPDYTITIAPGQKRDPQGNLVEGWTRHLGGISLSAAVYPEDMPQGTKNFNFGPYAGAVMAHELVHYITGAGDVAYNYKADLMAIDDARENYNQLTGVLDQIIKDLSGQNVEGFAKFGTGFADLLWAKCPKSHRRGGGGGGPRGGGRGLPEMDPYFWMSGSGFCAGAYDRFGMFDCPRVME